MSKFNLRGKLTLTGELLLTHVLARLHCGVVMMMMIIDHACFVCMILNSLVDVCFVDGIIDDWMNMECNCHLIVHSGRNLTNRLLVGKMDPFVEFTISGCKDEKFKTK